MKINKVFGIGLGHTATRSLNKALKILGINSIHWPTDDQTYKELREGEYNFTLFKEFQAITDITVAPIYKQLDQTHPGSKFILTVRDKASWLASMAKVNQRWQKYSHKNILVRAWRRYWDEYYVFKDIGKACQKTYRRISREPMIYYQRKALYGDMAFDDLSQFSKVFDRHYQEVQDYFKNRPQDLLIIDLFKGEGWSELCSFLDLPVPDKDFPHVKSHQYKQ